MPSPTKKCSHHRSALEKQLILCLGQGIYQISLKHLVKQESNKAIRVLECCQKASEVTLKNLPLAKDGTLSAGSLSSHQQSYPGFPDGEVAGKILKRKQETIVLGGGERGDVRMVWILHVSVFLWVFVLS